ncbi:hypothetical protein J4439_07005 [Candidatus Woesearchaeota archaeon]|nr:hypothetical protein [Candidatus Woesearchaeota archaeon]
MQPQRPAQYRDPVLFSIRELFPAMLKAQATFKAREMLSADFSGSAPAPFVGRAGYPYVNVGILSPPRIEPRAWEYDAPRLWSRDSYDISRIVQLRSELVNSRFLADVRLLRGRFLDASQEVAMASRPVEMEFHLHERPVARLSLSPEAAPTGPAAALKALEITSNPHVPRRIESAVSDTDLKAEAAVRTLFSKGVDEGKLTRLLSVGTLGVKAQRKLVPTRWSITAVDDIAGKALIREAKDCQLLGEHLLFIGEYLGNRFHVMLLPEVWGYELFETFLPTLSMLESPDVKYTTDHEGYDGRSAYAENCAGGYYAARLAVLERLSAMKRQARVVVLRVISEEYALPLGVWVVREAVRKAMRSGPQRFSSREEMLAEVRQSVSAAYHVDALYFFRRSRLLAEARTQRRLLEY